MGFFDKFMKRNTEGIAVPQYFNKTKDEYEPLEGSDGAGHVKLTGSNVPDLQAMPIKNIGNGLSTLETLINAQSLAPGGFIDPINLNITGKEKEVWVFVNIDQQPWNLMGSYATVQNGNDTQVLFPRYANHSITYSNVYTPATALYMGTMFNGTGLTYPTTMSEAKEFIMYNHGSKLRIDNKSAAIATITIKIMRVWR